MSKKAGVPRWTLEQFQKLIREHPDRVPDNWNGRAALVEETAPIIKRKKELAPNKTEASFEIYLKALYPESQVFFSRYTLRLGDDLRYTPDYVMLDQFGIGGVARVWFYEVKNEKRLYQKELTKPIAAAAQYPWHTFYIAILREGRHWDIQQINSR